jgi:hypothetical protein
MTERFVGIFSSDMTPRSAKKRPARPNNVDLVLIPAFPTLPDAAQQQSAFSRNGGCHKSEEHFKHDADHLPSYRSLNVATARGQAAMPS